MTSNSGGPAPHGNPGGSPPQGQPPSPGGGTVQPYTPWPTYQALLAVPLILGLGLIIGFSVGPLLLGQAGPGDPASALGPAFLISLLLMQCVITAATFVAAGRYGNNPWQALALAAPVAGGKAYAIGIAAMVALLVVTNLVLIGLFGHDPLIDLRAMAKPIRGDDWLLALLVLGIGAPISEELLIRGFLLPALKDRPLGFWGAAALSTALWTLLHIGNSPPGLVEIFLIGMLFCWLLRLTASLRVPLACHIVNNVVLVLALRTLPLPL